MCRVDSLHQNTGQGNLSEVEQNLDKDNFSEFTYNPVFKVTVNYCNDKLLLLLLLLSSSSSSSPLCKVLIFIFLRQNMSLGNKMMQLFCCYNSWFLYR